MSFRPSRYIDFGSGAVKVQPMELSRQRAAPWSLEDMLEMFECRVDVWQFGPAVEILKQIEAHEPGGQSVWAHAAYALLTIVSSYFEMIGKMLNPSSRPRGTAGVDFNYGFCDVYPVFDVGNKDRSDDALPDVRNFRDSLRNGLYHLGYTKSGLFIHNEPRTHIPQDFFVDRTGPHPRILVNPHQMTRTVVEHFPRFIRRLRDSSVEGDAMRARFSRFFQEFHRSR